MELKFDVGARIARPLEEVFAAVVEPAELSRYFTTGGAEGRLETGAVVQWAFHDFPGRFPVTVVEVDAPRRIVLRWDADDGADQPDGRYQTEVVMTFEALEGGRTLVRIAEHGWRENEAGQRASYGNCAGWMQMLCALKAWKEHGVNLRDGMFA